MIEMKLQKQIAYRYKDKVRHKYVVVVPNETVQKLGWSIGEELDNSIEGRTLILKPKIKE